MSVPTVRGDARMLHSLPRELWPSVEHLVIEDDTPVDGIYSEKQMRLLTRPLYSSWAGPADDPRFVALANVGLFFSVDEPPVVPDVLLSLHVQVASDLRPKENRSYFTWVFGKAPDATVEIVSNKEGGELDRKLVLYARIGVPVYIVWDPLCLISATPLQVFQLPEHDNRYEPTDPAWLPQLGLGLTVWHGSFEQEEDDWLRWCDQHGVVIPLGEERAEQERERAEQERERAEQERERAEQERERAEQERERAEQEQQRAEHERQLAEQERQRAEQAEQRLARLEAQLRRYGLEPGNGTPHSSND